MTWGFFNNIDSLHSTQQLQDQNLWGEASDFDDQRS